MILPEFKFHQPTSIDEAIEILGACDGDFDFVAGGTDVLPNYKNRLNNRKNVISLTGIKELHEVSGHRLGSMVTLRQIERSELIAKQLPVLAQAARQVATPLLRESATLGGNILLDTRCWFFNQSYLWRESKGFCLKAEGDICLVVPQKEICYATYSGDLAPVLMVLGASFHLAGPEGDREVPSEKFFTHDGITRNVKLPAEILTYVSFPTGLEALCCSYRKLRIRDSMDYPVMGTAVALRTSNRTIKELRIAVTGAGTTPFLYDEITAPYCGEQLTDELIAHISDKIMEEVQPYRNVHFSPQYRKAMVAVFLRRQLSQLAEEINGPLP